MMDNLERFGARLKEFAKAGGAVARVDQWQDGAGFDSTVRFKFKGMPLDVKFSLLMTDLETPELTAQAAYEIAMSSLNEWVAKYTAALEKDILYGDPTQKGQPLGTLYAKDLIQTAKRGMRP